MPLLLDLFCGRGGWTRAAHAAGWQCIGVDVVDHGYPAHLLMQPCPLSDRALMSLAPDAIVASPPCEDFARAHLPWLRTVEDPSTALLTWSIGLAARLAVPVVIECSRFAARHVPGARFAGSYALWGDLPALLPDVPRRKERGTGLDPARRAMIEPDLAGWILH